MKIKTMGRIQGSLELLLAGSMGYFHELSFNYSQFYEYILSESPIEYKIVVGAYYALPKLFLALVAADGLTDVIRGTHHYLPMKIVKTFTKSKTKEEKIQREIDKMLEIRNRELV